MRRSAKSESGVHAAALGVPGRAAAARVSPRGGGGGGKKEGEGKAPHKQIVTEAVRPVEAFIKTAALSTANIDELLCNLVKTAIQTLEQAGLYTRESGAGSSSSAAGPSAAAAMEVVNADDDDDEQDATPVQGDDGSVVLDADEVLDDDSDAAEPPVVAVAAEEAQPQAEVEEVD